MMGLAAAANPSANDPWSVDASNAPLANPAAMATGETATMVTSAQNSRLFSLFSEFSLFPVFPLFSALSTCYVLSPEYVNIRHQPARHTAAHDTILAGAKAARQKPGSTFKMRLGVKVGAIARPPAQLQRRGHTAKSALDSQPLAALISAHNDLSKHMQMIFDAAWLAGYTSAASSSAGSGRSANSQPGTGSSPASASSASRTTRYAKPEL
jgi:hypothetical protein